MAVATFPVGTVSYWTVPDAITVVKYRVAAGAGAAIPGSDLNAGETQSGGKAAVVEGYLTVTPGEQLWVAVGPAGAQFGVENGGGFGRGGARGGGCASALGRGQVSPAGAVVLAGGGGGGGQDGTGGNGGGIGGRGSGTAGYGLGGGQDPNYTSDVGEPATVDSTGGGGGGLVGGRAGSLSSDRRGGGGGGSSKVPSGATVTSTGTGPGSVTLTYGLAPLAPSPQSPAPGAVVAVNRDVDLVWAHNGAGTGDEQTSAVVTYTTGAGTFTAEVTGTTNRVTVPGLRVTAGAISWSVITRGQGGAASPSAGSSFTAAVAPVKPTITTPASPYASARPAYDVVWTSSDQAAWRIVRTNLDGSVVLADTGWVADPAGRRSTQTGTQNGTREVVRLTIRGSTGAVSEEATLLVDSGWTAPPTPSVVLVPDPANAALRVQVTRPAPGAGQPVRASSTYRALVLDGVDAGELLDVRVEADPDGVTRWRGPASDTAYLMAVTDRDALGVPAIGLSPAPAAGYGRSPYGAAPYGR